MPVVYQVSDVGRGHTHLPMVTVAWLAHKTRSIPGYQEKHRTDDLARGPTLAEFLLGTESGAGVVSSQVKIQKCFSQHELKTYIESVLETEAIPADIGIFYVFKDKVAEQQFLASRHRRAAAAPRKRISEVRFEENRELLEPFMATIAALGRLPEPDEFPQAAEIENRFGSLKRAFALVKRVTGTEEWEGITQRCTEDLLVYLALGRFRRRPPMSILPLGLQRDLRAFFGSYSNACRLADEVLFQAGKPELVDEACRKSPVGKLLPNALYVHRSRARRTQPVASRVRRMRPGLPGRDRRGEPDQAAPPIRQGLVPRLSRLRDRPAPCLGPQRQAVAAHPRDRLPRIQRQRRIRRSSIARRRFSRPIIRSMPSSPG